MITDIDVETTGEEPQKTDAEKNDADILRVAKERFAHVQEAEDEQRKLTEEDLNFSNGEQWEPEQKRSRQEDGRPTLTINRMPGFIHQVSNDIRQNRPAIKVSPVDDAADKETAKILQGIIRHIEYSSNADNAYDTATDSAIRGGYGYFRIVTEYADPMAFEQDIRIKRVPDRFSVRLDPSYQEPDGSDAEYAFVEEQVPYESFKARYPNSKIANSNEFRAMEKDLGDWAEKNSVRVTEYFWKEYVSTTILKVRATDPQTQQVVVRVVEAPKPPQQLGPGWEVVDQRQTVLPKVRWAKLNGCEILEKTDWLGSWIPIIPVLGEELVINGKKFLSGVIRHAKDSQRMYNFWKSSETEAIANAPRAPYIGVEGSFEGREAEWRLASKKNIPFLQYKPKLIGGTVLAPPPQRQTFEPAIQAITQAAMLAADDMKATTSIYDAAMGARSNENSGVAIQRRANQAQTSNFHFVDNLSKSIRHAGRIIVELIPKIYDTPRAIRILGEDGTEEIVRVNEMFKRENQAEPQVIDLNKGKYDVTVSVGPSYETKRQEAVQSQLEFMKVVPQHAPMLAHLMVKNMDWQGADEMAELLKKLLPPNLQNDGKGKGQPVPPEAQAQMQQMDQLIQGLTAQLNDAKDALEQKTLELESKERIELQKLKTQIELKLADLGSKEALALMSHQMNEMQQRLSVLGQYEPIEPQEQNAPMPQAAGPDQALPPEAMAQDQQQLPGELPPANSMEQP